MKDMNREIYPKVRVIMNRSNEEAKSFGDTKIKPEHILLAIFSDEDNECVRILNLIGFDVNEAYDKVSDFIRKTDITPRVTISRRKLLLHSDETKQILNRVNLECDKLNDSMIDVTHLFLSILFMKLEVNILLAKLGVTYNSFKKTMTEDKNDGIRIDIRNSALSNDENDESDSFRKKAKTGDVKSKTPVLDNFCRDISKAVEKGLIDPVVGRQTEIKRLSQILSRRKKNNPVLIGEPGVGKSSIVEGLAQLIKTWKYE